MRLLTSNDQIVLKTLSKYPDGLFRAKLGKLIKFNITSFHNSMVRLAMNEYIKVRQTKGKGNPNFITITEKGKIAIRI